MKYVATFTRAHAEAVGEAALLGGRHHINTWVSVPALPQHVHFHGWETAGSPAASPSHAMGSWGQPLVPVLPPRTSGGTQLHSLGVRKQRWRSTAKVSWGQLFCRPGVGSETANCSSALALPWAQRLRDTGLSLEEESELTNTSHSFLPTSNHKSPLVPSS